MIKTHRVLAIYFLTIFLSLLHLSLFMEFLRAGSLNINGGREGNKMAMVSELCRIKKVDIIFLQETHSNTYNE